MDPSADGLRTDGIAPNVELERISPLLLNTAPTHVAAGPDLDENYRANALAFVNDGRVWHLQHKNDGLYLGENNLPRIELKTANAPPTLQRIAVTETETFVLHDGGVDRLRWDRDGGSFVPSLSSARGSELRVLSGTLRIGIVHDDERYQTFSLDTGITYGPFRIKRADGGLQPLHDLVPFPHYNGPHPDYFLAATQEGLMMAVDAGSRFSAAEPVFYPIDWPHLPNARCATSAATYDAGYRALEIYPGLRAIGIGAAPYNASPDAGVSTLLIYAPNAEGSFTNACPPPYPLGGGNFHTLMVGPCRACPPGETLEGVQFINAGAYYIQEAESWIRLSCRSSTGLRHYRLGSLNNSPTQCERREETDPATLDFAVQQQTWSGQDTFRNEIGFDHGIAAAGQHGQLFRHAGIEPEAPILAHVPTAIFGAGTKLGAEGYLFEPGFGLVQANVFGTSGIVLKHPEWIVYDEYSGLKVLDEDFSVVAEGPVPGPTLMGTIQTDSTLLPDGGELIVVARRDLMFSAEVSGARPAELGVRDTPRPGSPILSVALAPPSAEAGAPIARAYVLTRDALMESVATTPEVWRSSEIEGPPGDWREVWFDGPRGRLGYEDGRVYGLPSRVLLAQAVPGGRVNDYAELCEQPFALTTTGLYRLMPPPDGAIGSWEPVDLTAYLPPHPDKGFSEGRLYGAPGELNVFTRYGAVVRLKATCPEGSP
ncbi:MAG: hypothetical protein M3Y59_01045 [Myxococcota bacterium]|nr:hypothetical protein [Myxococcota bacterium]